MAHVVFVSQNSRLSPVINFLKRIACLFTGHPCAKTGRGGFLITEVQCERCGGLYAMHPDHGRTLLPMDAEMEKIFKDEQEFLKRN